MRFLFMLLCLLAFNNNATSANLLSDKKVECPADVAEKYSCDFCYNGGSLSVGQNIPISWRLANTGELVNYYYRSELKHRTIYNPFRITLTAPLWEFDNEFFTRVVGGDWKQSSHKTFIGSDGIKYFDDFTFLQPGDNFGVIKTKSGFELGILKLGTVPVGKQEKEVFENRGLVIVYKFNAHFYNLETKSFEGESQRIDCKMIGIK